MLFRSQDWGDGGLPDVLQREYDLNRREGVLRDFLSAAYRRVVEPLKNQALRLPPRPAEGPSPFRPAVQANGPQEQERWTERDRSRRRPREEGEEADRNDPAR